MSTLAYARLTSARDLATPTTSTSTSPGVGMYVDALAALVPAEVLTLHALIITETTTTTADNATKIADPTTLFWAFWGLIVISAVLYAAPRWLDHMLDERDWIRVLIPPLAFTAWTMLQRTTAFDAVCSTLGQAPRSVIALFMAVVLAGAATALAYKADQKPPPAKP